MQKNKFFWPAVGILALVGIIFATRYESNIIQSAQNKSSSIYENEYLKVSIPSGWTAKEATETVVDNDVEQQVPNPAAVNITKGDYVIHINTQAEQASGVEGGRFAEIAMGALSVDAVITEEPGTSCGTEQGNDLAINGESHPRVDLYISANQQENKYKTYCVTPTNGSTVWYFSYITNKDYSNFNYYKEGEAKAFVITMYYNSKDINNFPVKGSTELNATLAEMNSIVKSLEIPELKTWKTYNNDKYGFELRYSTDWNLSVNNNDLQHYDSFLFESKTSEGLHILVFSDDSNETLEQFLAKADKESRTAYEGSPSYEVLSSKNIVVFDDFAIQRMEHWYDVVPSVTIKTYLKHGSQVYSFELMPGNDGKIGEISKSEERTYNHILFTFKFTK